MSKKRVAHGPPKALEEARKYNVLPLDDRGIERFNAELVGRPMTGDDIATRRSRASDSRDQSADGDGSDATACGKGSLFQAASREPLLTRAWRTTRQHKARSGPDGRSDT